MEHKRIVSSKQEPLLSMSDDEQSQFNYQIRPKKKIKLNQDHEEDPNDQLFKQQFNNNENNNNIYSHDLQFLRACSFRTISARQQQKVSSLNAFQQLQSDKKKSKRRKSFGMSSQKNNRKINSLKELLIDRGSCCSLASDFDKQNQRYSINTINTAMINEIRKIKIDQNQEQQNVSNSPQKVIRSFSQIQMERQVQKK